MEHRAETPEGRIGMSAIQEAGQVVAGRYRLERALARGGMGSVWVARRLQLDTDVAVKFMTVEAAASANARLRFEREAKAVAKLKRRLALPCHALGRRQAPHLLPTFGTKRRRDEASNDVRSNLRQRGPLRSDVTPRIYFR
jgi:serine/threonine protein kinase